MIEYSTSCVFYFVCFQRFSQTSHPSEHSCEYSSCRNLNVFQLIKPFHSLVSKKKYFLKETFTSLQVCCIGLTVVFFPITFLKYISYFCQQT